MAELDPLRIQQSLERLRSMGAIQKVFGANGHGFLLNPTLSESQVLAFEAQHRISLPTDYRKFLLRLGNGGAGPYYGIFPLGQMDWNNGMKPWHEGDGFVGVLSEPFVLVSDWNDLNGMPSDDRLQDVDEAEYQRRFDEFDERYWSASLMNGAVPICHEGCALWIWLIVAGEQAGRVWDDRRAEYKGVKPVLTADGSPATFSLWYNEWLESATRAATL